jgi:hypothetical protein
MYQYVTKVFASSDMLEGVVDKWLNERGEDGWRLHTFDHLPNGGVLVAMDRMIAIEEEPDLDEPAESQGMAIRG